KEKKAKPIVALVAVQRKMLILMFELWKKNEYYDPEFEQKKQQAYKKLAARGSKQQKVESSLKILMKLLVF
ncbi:MAG: hypothetical protein HWE22_16055, partial [Flavobacteriales bacterium]|nr:hypothetical protein [Flavobacteriales bacterium]